MAHTPGPWEVTERPTSDDGRPKLHIDAHAGNFAVARVFESEGEVGKANAKLLAAAPEMLEALVQAAAHLKELQVFEAQCAYGFIKAILEKLGMKEETA